MRKGFTLIELLVVVIIIGICSVFAVGSFTGSIERARNKVAVENMRALWDGINMYKLKYTTAVSCNNAGPSCAGVAACNAIYDLAFPADANCDWLYWVDAAGFYAQRNVPAADNRYRKFNGFYAVATNGQVTCTNGPGTYCDFTAAQKL
jgi:prepilin-type N-terminal cleavage/methylation domain-containing protein